MRDATDTNGNHYITYVTNETMPAEPGKSTLHLRVFEAKTACWLDPVPIARGHVNGLEIAATPDGAVVVWGVSPRGPDPKVLARRYRVDTRELAPERIVPNATLKDDKWRLSQTAGHVFVSGSYINGNISNLYDADADAWRGFVRHDDDYYPILTGPEQLTLLDVEADAGSDASKLHFFTQGLEGGPSRDAGVFPITDARDVSNQGFESFDVPGYGLLVQIHRHYFLREAATGAWKTLGRVSNCRLGTGTRGPVLLGVAEQGTDRAVCALTADGSAARILRVLPGAHLVEIAANADGLVTVVYSKYDLPKIRVGPSKTGNVQIFHVDRPDQLVAQHQVEEFRNVRMFGNSAVVYATPLKGSLSATHWFGDAGG